jgi:putative transposase
VARLLDGEKMAALCREFDVSRKTGYKIFQRYKDCGLEGLTDRSRRPYRQANRLPFQIEKLIVQFKRERPHWGAPKIRDKLIRLHSDIPTPAISTVHAVLDRHGLVSRGRKRRPKAQGTALSNRGQPTICGAPTTKASSCSPIGYCYHHQRLRHSLPDQLRGLVDHPGGLRLQVIERVFKSSDCPKPSRTDNGVPFASPLALFGASSRSGGCAAGIPHRAHQARPSRAEWPP